jgi:DNA-binding MarR family transcriptional regulator
MPSDPVPTIVAQWAQERPDLDASPLLVIGRLQYLTAYLDPLLRPPFAERGLGNGDFDVLAALRRAGSPFQLRPVELSMSLLVTTGAITKRLDRLEAQGLLERKAESSDGRAKITRLTAAGLALTNEMIEAHLSNQERLLQGLSRSERTDLAFLLGRLAESIESQSDPPPTASSGEAAEP